MALRNVHYRLHAEIRPWPEHRGRQAALEAQFRRRAERGKCFYQPFLGCREFPAWFRLVETPADQPPAPPPIPLDLDVGFMLYDVFDLSRPGTSADAPAVSLFRASVRGGVLEIPEYASADVYKAGGAP
jgi:CRISPR-associated protein Cas5d